tara:strand:+ start:1131 stop:1589 length:459 start_codon:yes stop_codon:yes gene_type:complete
MFKVNKMTDYAVVCISILSKQLDGFLNAQEISSKSGISLFTVQKILKILASKSDFLVTLRGSNGGYKLSKPASEILIIQIIEMLDGPIKITSCVEGANEVCNCSDLCLLQGNWNKVNHALIKSLRNFSVEDLLHTEDLFALEKKNNYQQILN